jgi:hypothetical protein
VTYQPTYYPAPQRKRRVWPWIALALVGLCLLGIVVSAVGGRNHATTGVTPTATTKAKPAASSTTAKAATKAAAVTFGEGSWEVGSEIKPGTYTTTAGDDAYCYWARLKSFDGELGAVIANGNLDPGGRGRIVVKKSDKGLELTGGCTWKLSGGAK